MVREALLTFLGWVFSFFVSMFFGYFFVPCSIREFKSPAQHISGRSACPGLGQTIRFRCRCQLEEIQMPKLQLMAVMDLWDVE